jgi:thiol-disulfide isomerase/thioredoxin
MIREAVNQDSGRRARRIMIVAGAAVVSAAVAAAALYYVGSEFLTVQADRQGLAAGTAPESAGSPSSHAFKFSFFDQPRSVPELRFVDGDNRSLSLEDFRGRPILLNIWATWCVPCRKEMPAFDRLQGAFDKSELLVLPLSIDRQGAAVVKPFYQELGLKSLGIYIDQSGKASSELNTVGVPTTLLIDREGREIGRKIGPAEWDSAEVIAVMREHVGLPSSEQKQKRTAK